jgi:microcystin-dependent protein
MALDKFKVKKGIDIIDSLSLSGTPLTPPGTIALWPTATCPSGWVECNGQELPIGLTGSQYNNLYVTITNNGSVFPFGANTNGSNGAGSTHFRVPELEGRIAIGSGTGTGLTGRTLGSWGGANSVSITNDITSHTHTMTHNHGMSHTHDTSGHINPGSSPTVDSGGLHFNALHTHTMPNHNHGGYGDATASHNHFSYFGNTGAPGTAFRMQSNPQSPAVNVTSSGDHTHTVTPSASIGDVFADNNTSGNSNSLATGNGTGSTNGPSQASTTLFTGSDTTISVVQSSYSLMYVMKV